MGRRILKIVGVAAGAFALALLALLGYGAMLPEEHTFVRAMQLAQPPEVVFAALADFRGHPAWRPDVARLERLPDRDGKPAWRITDRHNVSMLMVVEEARAPQKLALRFSDESGPAEVQWEFIVGPIPGGSLVTLREKSRMKNSFYRAVNRLFFGTKFADDFLRHLARKFGQEAVIQ
jgi:uncharacterized protein YndB with AHSA1/START domain